MFSYDTLLSVILTAYSRANVILHTAYPFTLVLSVGQATFSRDPCLSLFCPAMS